ncbi:oligosaccharide flippase family protein [Pedobacter sp. MC2016-15]|uniref:lipopolysaccharide biosynthesis protein n=1 Tax=Pedobacter sp. MC2016-15 TaxID=2994473 RepID=UPI0022486CA9|nr:oligosaccharide flippase family protein [Pedobacter sp. MC2016-15]MCX2477730.1 oligosaccharide flippase family protein [Pedobacter sp. MC2016-15]
MKSQFSPKNIFGRSGLVSNSLWGIVSTLFQTLFLSAFFVILSRQYSITEFSHFLIANTIYQLIVGFSSMGLGLWFIREYGHETDDRDTLVYRFIKVQGFLGIVFYAINIALAFVIYEDQQIRMLTLILGTNIIFDNIIYALKHLNIAQSEQRKTAIIMAVEGLLRLIAGCLLFVLPISLAYLSIVLVVIRLLTVGVFIQIGSGGSISLKKLWLFKISWADLQKNVLMNWKFILIVGSSILFWRSATIIISKYLTAADVANYEISYKIFSIFTMLCIVASTTIYPRFVKLIAANDYEKIRSLYSVISMGFGLFVIFSYAFMYSFSDILITLIFGDKFLTAGNCMKEMFLTLIVFPTVFLQANLLVAMKLEKMDMLLNFMALVINLTCSLIGLHFFSSLSVLNYSIFISFTIFHISQNILLIRMKINTIQSAVAFYVAAAAFILCYQFASQAFDALIVFACFFLLVMIPAMVYLFTKIRGHFENGPKENLQFNGSM